MIIHRLKSSNSPGFPTIKTETGQGPGRKPRDAVLLPPISASGSTTPRPSAPSVPSLRPPGLVQPVSAALSPRRRFAAIRQKIADSDLPEIMIDFVAGRRELSSDQVFAGMGLMKKIVPDLATIDLEAEEIEDDTSPDFEVSFVDPKA